MSYCDVYIGLLDDEEFSWEDGNNNGNIPKRRSPFFPSIGTGVYQPFSIVISRIESGIFKGKRTDFAGWVAIMTKHEIKEFVDEIYASPEDIFRTIPHLQDQLNELYIFVDNLTDDQAYLLVACEL